MERFGNRGSVLLGYNPSSSMEPSSSSRNSDEVDVDFNDVFGGPPRRFSIHGIRHSFGGGSGDGGMMESGEAVSRSPWAVMSTEKPVFGEEIGDRRLHASDDFYDDIFRGSEGSYGSPGKSSTPGSRVLSPARPLPPKAEPFGTSLPAQFSLPAKLNKPVDLPTFGSSPRSANKHKDGSSTPNTSLSRFSSQSFQDQNVQSLLSPELPFSNEEASYITKSNEHEVVGNLKGSAKRLEVLVRKGQFHFSIYKWPNIGIPLLSPFGNGRRSSFKENGKFERCLSSKGRIEHDFKASESPTDSCFLTKDLSAIINNTAESFQIVEEEGLKNVKLQPFETTQREEIKLVSLPESGLPDGNKKEFSIVRQEINKPIMKPLRSMLHDDNEEQGDVNTLKNDDGKENMEKVTTVPRANLDVTSNVKKHEEKKRGNKKTELNKDHVTSSRNSGDNHGKSRVKGKVKDFVKIFNQETPSMSKPNVAGKSQGSRGKYTENDGADSEVVANEAMENEKAVPIVEMKPDASFMVEKKSEKSRKRNSGLKTKKPDMNTKPDSSFTVEETVEKSDKEQRSKIPTTPNASFMAEERIEKLKKQQSGEKSTKPDVSFKTEERNENFSNQKTNKKPTKPDASFTVKEGMEKSHKKIPEPKTTIHTSNNDRPAQIDASQRPESFARRYNVSVVDIDDMFDDNFQIQELAPEEDLDSKIRQWSKGKIGNIRSLLSTLQLVLWPESGWKPVPLMDVIEGNQVKRAYQRALLCLHPDKLQQKGAADHQKYIAEKVFDILQEAWDQFNSIGIV